MSAVLITGSCGLVGSEASKFFCEKGFDVLGIDNNYRKFFFGTDGDTSWVKKSLVKNYKNYKHFNNNIVNSTKQEMCNTINNSISVIFSRNSFDNSC